MRNAERFAGAGERGIEFAEFIHMGRFRRPLEVLARTMGGDLRPVLWMLQAVVDYVLLIACANVANLMLTRERAPEELSVRGAEAGRGRIARQLLVEALLLALLGGIGGIVLAYLSLDLLQLLPGPRVWRLADQVGIDSSAGLHPRPVALLTGVVFGLFPALAQLGGKPYEVLKDGGRGNAGGRGARATRNVLVVCRWPSP